MFTVSDPNSLVMHAVTIVFYLALALFSISSAITLYSLIRYSRQRGIVMAVTATYIVLVGALFLVAVGQLHQVQF